MYLPVMHRGLRLRPAADGQSYVGVYLCQSRTSERTDESFEGLKNDGSTVYIRAHSISARSFLEFDEKVGRTA